MRFEVRVEKFISSMQMVMWVCDDSADSFWVLIIIKEDFGVTETLGISLNIFRPLNANEPLYFFPMVTYGIFKLRA